MAHTTLSTLATTFTDNYNAGSPVTLADNTTFTVPGGIPAGEWFWVPLPDSTFDYNSSDNLIVEVQVTAGSGYVPLRRTTLPKGARAWGYEGDDVAEGTDGTAYHIKLRFNGGTMDVMTDGNQTQYYPPFGWVLDEFKMQSLYDNTALGTSGQITEFGVRIGNDSVAYDHGDINLILGHTTLSSLGPTFSANMESDLTVVFSGTISIPAGLKAGDWVRVPFSTPFQYDTTKNLVAQWDGPVNASGIFFIGHTENTGRYAGHMEVNSGDRTSDTSIAAFDILNDTSLTIVK
jgi:hypothetical protein